MFSPARDVAFVRPLALGMLLVAAGAADGHDLSFPVMRIGQSDSLVR